MTDRETQKRIAPQDKFYRIKDRAVVGGVCAGVADHYRMKDDTVRYLYIAACFLVPFMVSVYLFQWLVYPEASDK